MKTQIRVLWLALLLLITIASPNYAEYQESTLETQLVCNVGIVPTAVTANVDNCHAAPLYYSTDQTVINGFGIHSVVLDIPPDRIKILNKYKRYIKTYQVELTSSKDNPLNYMNGFRWQFGEQQRRA